MPVAITTVDAFTDTAFGGNPAGVCLLPAAGEASWMQRVAREMNLSETAFLVPRPDGFDLRWFTPAVEVDLCGHATLASAHVLWETGVLPHAEEARFHTRSGLLTAERRDEWIHLDFPATPAEPCEPDAAIVDALGGARVLWMGRSRFDVVVELESEAAVRATKPDFRALARIPDRGLIVTSRSDEPAYDFVSRYFAPSFGIDEDPATGSTHCALAPFWSERFGKSRFVARQVSVRGGVMRVELLGGRVRLGGQAVTMMRGELLA